MATMDEVLGQPATGTTPHEQGELEAQLAKDALTTEKAEQLAKELPPGHQWYRCPDSTCSFGGSGPPGGTAEKALQGHIQRHWHAREAMALKRAS